MKKNPPPTVMSEGTPNHHNHSTVRAREHLVKLLTNPSKRQIEKSASYLFNYFNEVDELVDTIEELVKTTKEFKK